MTSRKLPVINGLRGIAVLGVLLIHLLFVPVWMHPSLLSMRVAGLTVSPLTPLTNAGTGGVALFFILSGFVLALPYVRGTRHMATFGDARTYWARRVRRLLPLFLIGAATALALFPHLSRGPREPALLFTMLFVWLPTHVMPGVNPVLWSVGVEWWLSLAFPLLIVAQRRLGAERTLLIAVMVAAATRLWATMFADAGVDTNVFRLPPMRVDDFVLGMALAEAYVRGTLPGRMHALLGSAMILLGFVLLDSVRVGMQPHVALVTNHLLIGIGLTLVAGTALRVGSRSGSVLTWKPLQAIGVACYSFYVWHLPLQWLISPMESLPRFAAYVIFVSIVSFVSYHVIEFPRRTLGRQLCLRRRPLELAPVGGDPPARDAEEVQPVAPGVSAF